VRAVTFLYVLFFVSYKNSKVQAAVILGNELSVTDMIKYFKEKKKVLVLHYMA
jgi:hypothetical protein